MPVRLSVHYTPPLVIIYRNRLYNSKIHEYKRGRTKLRGIYLSITIFLVMRKLGVDKR